MAEHEAKAAQWLPAARAGSKEALGQALEACRGYLLTVSQKELAPDLQPKGGASDIVQQTLLDAFRAFPRFQGETEVELLKWLRRLLLNNVGDFARQYREAGKRQIDREVALEAGNTSAERGLGLAGSVTSPSGQVIAHEQSEAIRRILERLPEDYRRVIVLRYQDQQPFEEIGRALAMTPNAARKLLLRAVERVRQELEGPS